MKGRKAIVGLCVFCALLVSAVGAQSAGAISGTTAFTCVKTTKAPSQFTDPHCKEGGEGEYKHVEFAASTTTSLRVNDVEGMTKFKSTVGGLGITITASELEAGPETWMTNAVDPNGEHYAHGEGTARYTGVTVSVAKCFVYIDEGPGVGGKEEIITEKIRGTTTGQGDGVKFEPLNQPKVFARFWILDKNKTIPPGGECNIAGTYSVTGSVVGTPEGATVTFTHTGTTMQNTLKMGAGAGTKAGIEGSLTLEGEDTDIGSDAWTPLSPTTVET